MSATPNAKPEPITQYRNRTAQFFREDCLSWQTSQPLPESVSSLEDQQNRGISEPEQMVYEYIKDLSRLSPGKARKQFESLITQRQISSSQQKNPEVLRALDQVLKSSSDSESNFFLNRCFYTLVNPWHLQGNAQEISKLVAALEQTPQLTESKQSARLSQALSSYRDSEQYMALKQAEAEPKYFPLDMVYIPPGSFLMGSPEDEQGWHSSQSPQHEVTIAQPFFMSKYPVTQAQWRAVAEFPQVERELNPDPSKFKGDNRPVEQVSWHDAVEFCRRLEQATRRPYRLPTEAQWEYAARAGTTTPFHFGESITTDLANYRGTDWEYEGKTYPGAYGDGPYGEFREETTEVGSFEVANAFGLYDIHGNVWEWCQDVWHDSYDGAPADGAAWLAGSDQTQRILRGGSWLLIPGNCRSAFRFRLTPVGRYGDIGFRVVCGLASGLS